MNVCGEAISKDHDPADGMLDIVVDDRKRKPPIRRSPFACDNYQSQPDRAICQNCGHSRYTHAEQGKL